MFDPDRIRQVAAALQTNERYIEKDCHLVRALGVISSIRMEGISVAFSGGTSLGRAWQLIHRFSEDIDFKVHAEAASARVAKDVRRAYRQTVVDALTGAGFVLDGEPMVRNEGRFFRVSFHYGPAFPAAGGTRPGLQVEMSFTGTHLPPRPRPVQSLLAQAFRESPEIAALPCVDPVETMADKLCALAWRTAVRDRNDPKDDPAVVRHLHDLAALAPQFGQVPELPPLVRILLFADAKRAKAPDALEMLRAMLPKITGDPRWRKEYEEFVGAVSFGPEADRISFDKAVAICDELVAKVLAAPG